MRFSSKTAWEPGNNDWADAVEAARRDNPALLDLTSANPTACGLGMETGAVLAPLSHPGALRYTPDPFGMAGARAAVAGYYRDHGTDVPETHLCLTTSTSEAYSFLFRLLCDPGDEVLIARPSYPLFGLLAAVDDVTLREYTLLKEPGAGGHWSIDLHGLEAQIHGRTRAIVVVHPNNPTGNYVGAGDRQALVALCAKHDLALLVDEVFLDFTLADPQGADRHATFAGEAGCLTFVLSGLSKVCALPQMKCSWIAASGPTAVVEEAMRRLEIVADTFLSLNAPVQYALQSWLPSRSAVQTQIRQRLRANLDTLDRRLAGSLADRLHLEGGWTAVLRVPRHVAGEPFSLAALQRGVVVQPGEFYGLGQATCVVSLLTQPDVWSRGLALLPV